MTPLRKSDRIFLAVAVPLAAIAAYAWCWRIDAAKNLDKLAGRVASLVSMEDFSVEKARARRALEEAKALLESEKSATSPHDMVIERSGASLATRENDILKVFAESGVTVVKSENSDGGDSGGLLRSAAGIERPACRKYLLNGNYPSVKRSLDLLSERKLPVLPERIEMKSGSATIWEITLWE